MTSGISQTCPEVGEILPNKENRYTVSKTDLPLHCPMDGMSLWNSHPRVFIKMKDGRGKCPYCGAEYEVSQGPEGV
ncbi:hypothetical protein MNBD_GAMMA18-2101 [hydrothermal vent metagenome]|uniref:Zinc finger CHCC-type domain-containing protein n=1 Tax=hydrothermal vent metagenome TaxID=652676 RepID=A0A3B0ZB16_9ZZZZ